MYVNFTSISHKCFVKKYVLEYENASWERISTPLWYGWSEKKNSMFYDFVDSSPVESTGFHLTIMFMTQV